MPGLSAGFIRSPDNDIFFEISIVESYLIKFLLLLKYHSPFLFNFFIDFCVYDLPGKESRFIFLYILRSNIYNSKLIVKLNIEELSYTDSITPIFIAADWAEREAWDMFGVFFLNHPNLKRILTDYNFSGHPLRKDFPLSGFREIYYDDVLKRIVFVKVELAQEYRNYELHTIWSNLVDEVEIEEETETQ